MTFHVVKLVAPADHTNCVRYDIYYILSKEDYYLHRIGAYTIDSNFVEKWCHIVNCNLTLVQVTESEFVKIMKLAGYTMSELG